MLISSVSRKTPKIEVEIPVVFINEEDSPGLKKGGVLNVVRHELELICSSDKIPNQIEIDVTGLEVGDAIHFSEITFPEGSESQITDRDFTIVTVVAPSALKRAEGEEGDDEGEVPADGVASSEQGPDADAAQEQEDKSE